MKKLLVGLAAGAALMLSACAPEPMPPMRQLPRPAPLVSARPMVTPKGTIPITAQQVKVALLLPLSGESSAIGTAMLDAATMAVYDAYVTAPPDAIRSQVVLMPKDTGSLPADALRMAQQSLDQGARLFIGPLFSQSVTAITPLATARRVNVVSFSNNQAAASDGVFVYGFLPEQQVARMADYAYLHGLTRIAVLAPNDAYGQKIKETLAEAYARKGGLIAPAEFYAPVPANIDAAVARLAAAYGDTVEERRFQAIYIAEGGDRLKTILAALKKYHIDTRQVKLLGTGLWDDEDIARLPDMAGAWFPSSPPGNYAQFEKRFMAMYNYKPPRLASLAYDAVTLATRLVMSQPAGITTASLANPQGFTGPANGLYRLRPGGTSERALAIMEITPHGVKVIDQAPRSFDK